jgi:hypothetical protein
MRMEQSSILSIGATSSVLVPHPCISIISTIPLSKGRCNYGPHESATGEVSYVTDGKQRGGNNTTKSFLTRITRPDSTGNLFIVERQNES